MIVVRLVHLQVLERPFFQRQSARQSERTVTLEARRGSILDRGRPAPRRLRGRRERLRGAPGRERSRAHGHRPGRALGLDAAGRKELLAQLQKNRAFVWVKRKLSPGAARAVRDLQLDGIGFLSESRRYYPKRELASQVLGYVGLDNLGMSGVEYGFESTLKGRKETVVVTTDARHRPVGHTEKPSTEGLSVVLALDEAIQYAAERELDRAMAETQSLSGVVVVVDPFTGEVLAMANRPTFNPNSFQSYPSARWKNRAVADAYEPGCIFKIVTAAAGLQEKVVEPEEVLDCGHGTIEIAGVSHQRPRGLRQALLPHGRGQVERHRHDPGGAAPGPRAVRPLHARLRVRRAHRGGAARRVLGPAAPHHQVERHLPGLALLRPGGGGHRAADGHGRLRGGQRRLPHEAARGAPGRGQGRPRGEGEQAPGRAAGACSRRPWTSSPTS